MLTYSCAICRQPFTSLLIPRHQAAKELGEQMQAHLRKEHNTEFTNFVSNDLGKITMLASGIAMVNKFVEYDPLDTISIGEHNGNIEQLMDLMGFDEAGEDDIEYLPSVAEEIAHEQMIQKEEKEN